MNLDEVRRAFAEHASRISRLEARQRGVRSALAVLRTLPMSREAHAILDALHDAFDEEGVVDLTMRTTPAWKFSDDDGG